jgi:hypothetical protein
MLPNRSIVQFRSLEDPDRGRGQGLNWLWIDEICKLTEKHWEVILPSLADRAGILIATTTPKGEDWVHERLFVPAESGRKGYWACVYRTIDNPLFASREELRQEIDEARATMTPEMFRQEFEAEIVTFTGAIFGAQVERGVIEGTEEEMQAYIPEWPNISADRPAITGLDPGADHPFAGVHLVQTPKGLVAVGEYAERARPFLLHAQGIALMRKGSTSRVMIDRSQAQAQVELAQYGLFTVPADNDVIAGINRISAWLAANKLDQGKLPVGGLILPRSCVPTLIRQLRKYRWAETDKKDGSKGRELVYKKDDDEVDALRYGLMGYPVLPKAHPEAAGVGKRDLSALPEQIRAEIERERKSMGKEAAKAHPDDGAGVVEDWEGSMGDFTLY